MKPSEISPLELTIQATYSQLEDCVEQARPLVPVGRVEQLLKLMPPGSLENQRFILCELIKLDMGAAAELGQVRQLDFYLPHCGRWLGTADIPIDLILEELQVRRDSGDSPSLSEYQRRFPRWGDVLADFRWDQPNSRQWSLPPPLPELTPGQVVEDFRIIRLLGRGAFAQVYLARQESMQRLVALKISAHGSDEPQTLSQLDHANIVRVYDQRTLGELNVHLLYMQVMLGGTLAGVVKSTRELPLAGLSGKRLFEAVDQALLEAEQQPPDRSQHPVATMNWAATTAWLGVQLAEGLQSAHDLGVYHRDVKPANILLSPEGRPKLADFNVSNRHREDGRQSPLGGTMAYMAPEHLQASLAPELAERVDHRSDLFSLAMVLWELWQGQRPWQVDTAAETWRSAVGRQYEARHTAPPCPRSDSSPAGRWLERVLRHSLSPDPAQRPRSCQELATRLQLAHHPELVARFAPADGSLVKRLLQLPVLLVTALIIFSSNGPAGVMNYIYNKEVIVSKYVGLLPHFVASSTILNLIAFPLGGVLLIAFCWKVRRCLIRAQRGQTAAEADVDWVWRFGHRAAAISGFLWLLFGLIFPVTMQRFQPDFELMDFYHFFMSLAVCGGMAIIYPFFGISLLATYIYYPQLVAPTMQDDRFRQRAEWLRRKSDIYLFASAVVPLLAIGLLIMLESNAPRALQLCLVGLTLVGLTVSFKAHQLLQRVIEQYTGIFGQAG